MSIVSIYLRSVEQKDKFHLAMFDSNRNGAIDDLTTEVHPGDTIVWKLDSKSGIKAINRIATKSGKGNVFRVEPFKRLFCRFFVLRIPKDAQGEEAYFIEYVLCNGKKLTIDPYIRIKLPGSEG
jgi:hypothetical protein